MKLLKNICDFWIMFDGKVLYEPGKIIDKETQSSGVYYKMKWEMVPKHHYKLILMEIDTLCRLEQDDYDSSFPRCKTYTYWFWKQQKENYEGLTHEDDPTFDAKLSEYLESNW